MPKPYSLDLHERVVGHVEAGHWRRAAAAHFGVSASFVIMDNLPAHKSPTVKAILDKGTWVLFLPPYGPDLNPRSLESHRPNL